MTALETPRLKLRPFRLEDAPDVASYSTRPEFNRYLPLPPQTPESALAFVEGRVRGGQPDDAGEWHFAVQLASKVRLIGAIRVGVREPEHRQGDVGYALNPDFQGRGYMTEALIQVLNFGFQQLDLERIWATADIQNTASWRLMERAGMKREGVMPHHRLHQGEWRDSVLYGIVRQIGLEKQA